MIITRAKKMNQNKETSKLTKKLKNFLIVTSEELREEFSRKNEAKIIPEDAQGFFFYIGELCSGVLTIDGLFRMGYAMNRGLKKGNLFKPDYSNCFDAPVIIGYVRVLK